MTSYEKNKLLLFKHSQGLDRALPWCLCLAFVMFIAGLFLPVLEVKSLWLFHHKISILSAQMTLFKERQYVLFFIVFIFSLVLPVVKMVFMLLVWFFADLSKKQAKKLLYWATVLSKWSMLDVFVLALLLVLSKLGLLANVRVHPGIYVFTAAILLSSVVSYRIYRLAERD